MPGTRTLSTGVSFIRLNVIDSRAGLSVVSEGTVAQPPAARVAAINARAVRRGLNMDVISR